jgi:RNA polymerase sigma factor (sigma-70 family)
MVEDELLKRRFKSGDPKALRKIYDKYRDFLLTLAMQFVNEADLAEDIVHDVFVTLVKSQDRFRLCGNLKSYLATCVANRMRDQLRLRKRRSARLQKNGSRGGAVEAPFHRLISDERSRHVCAALAQLSNEQREVVVLHLNAQMKLREIAARLDVPLSTVRGRYRHGLEQLRSLLNGRLDNDTD